METRGPRFLKGQGTKGGNGEVKAGGGGTRQKGSRRKVGKWKTAGELSGESLQMVWQCGWDNALFAIWQHGVFLNKDSAWRAGVTFRGVA